MSVGVRMKGKGNAVNSAEYEGHDRQSQAT